MSIWGRLGNVIKSYINDDSSEYSSWSASSGKRGDPDLDAAYDELNDFLRGDGGSRGGSSSSGPGGGSRGSKKEAAGEKARTIPAELREDFAELGLSPEASAGECKSAYKKFLKIHHPDRHAGNPELMKKATEKAARVNAAYSRLEKWFRERK